MSVATPSTGLQAAALAALTAGHMAQARALVDSALAEATAPVERAELVRLRARLSVWSGPIRLADWAQVVQAAEQIAAQAPRLAAALLCDAAVLAAYTRQLPQAEQLAGRALELTAGKGTVGAWAATGLGITYGLTGRHEQAAPLLERAGELLDPDGGIVEAAEMLLPSVLALVVQERYDDAVDTAARFLSAARSLGAVGLLPLPLCLLAHAGWKAGRWEEARLAAAEARTLSTGTGEVALELYAGAMLALVAGGQGREVACRELVDRTMELSDSTGIGMFRVTAQMSLVHLALGLDRPAEALAPLAEVGRLMAGQRRSGMLNWHGDHIDVLVGLGRLGEAGAVLATLEQEAPGNRWESAALLRCRGQVAGSVQDLQASVDAFSWQPYEQARSRLRLAARLAGDDPAAARQQATEACRAFTALRARGWAAQAEALLGGPGSDVPPQRRREDDPSSVEREPADDVQLELRLLGGFTVLRSGVPVTIATGTAAQAVKYVAVRGGRTSADELVEALWPDAEPGRGRVRLRNVLARLRRDGEVLVRCGDELALPTGCRVDVDAFLQESAAALAGAGPDAERLARAAVQRYAGELLPGDRYQEWTSGPRERLRARYLELLDRLAQAAAGRGDVDAALSWWERAVDVEPYDEDRYVAMASLLVRHGRLGGAHRIVRRALAVLERLGVPPSPSLLAVATARGSG